MISDERVDELAAALIEVAGVRAVALGGSRARGTHRPDSDVDLGLYYDFHLDLDQLRAVARHWHGGEVEVAGPHGWGLWVDGGAWLRVDDTPVDLILRRNDRVARAVDEVGRGEFDFHQQAGHPLGFWSAAYAGEVAVSQPLRDPHQLLSGWKARLDPYPTALRDAMIDHLWHPEFLLGSEGKAARYLDVAHVAMVAAVTAMTCAHVWHALAGVWVINEKNLVPGVAKLPIDSHGFSERMAALIGDLGTSHDSLTAAIEALTDEVARTRAAAAQTVARH